MGWDEMGRDGIGCMRWWMALDGWMGRGKGKDEMQSHGQVGWMDGLDRWMDQCPPASQWSSLLPGSAWYLSSWS